MNDDILFSVAAGVATITLNRPRQRNAIRSPMSQMLADMLLESSNDRSVRCVVICGAGKDFCSGGDVKGFAESLELSPDARHRKYEERVKSSIPLFKRIEDLDKPLITIIRGAVAGAGMTFALAADFALASETSFFSVAQTKIGLALDSGLSFYLPRTMGLRKAREITLSGRRIDANEALSLGIVTQLYKDEALDAAATVLTTNLASAATTAIRLSKRLLRQSLSQDIENQMHSEASAIGQCVRELDFEEGVSAFLGKRRPRFENR